MTFYTRTFKNNKLLQSSFIFSFWGDIGFFDMWESLGPQREMFLEWCYDGLISWQRGRVLRQWMCVWKPHPVSSLRINPFSLQLGEWPDSGPVESVHLQFLRWSQAGVCHNSDGSDGRRWVPETLGRMPVRRLMGLTWSVQHVGASWCWASLKRTKDQQRKFKRRLQRSRPQIKGRRKSLSYWNNRSAPRWLGWGPVIEWSLIQPAGPQFKIRDSEDQPRVGFSHRYDWLVLLIIEYISC